MPFLRAALLKKNLRKPEPEQEEILQPQVIIEEQEPEEEFEPTKIEELHRLIDIRTEEAEDITETETVIAPEPAVEFETVTETEAVTETEHEVEIEAVEETEAVPESEQAVEIETVQEIETVSETEQAVEIETVKEIEAVPESEQEVEIETVKEIETVSESEHEVEIETVKETETVIASEPIVEFETFTETEDVSESETDTTIEADNIFEADTEIEIVPDPDEVLQEVSQPEEQEPADKEADFDENSLLDGTSAEIPEIPQEPQTDSEQIPDGSNDTDNDSESVTAETEPEDFTLKYDFTSGERYVDKVSTKTEFDKMLDELAEISRELLSWQTDKFAREFTNRFQEETQAEARKYEAFLGGYITNAAMLLYDKGYRDTALKQLEQAKSILEARKKLEDETSAIKSRVEEQNDAVDLSDILGLFGDG